MSIWYFWSLMHSQKTKVGISAIIPAFNESDCIRKAIESVLWADEIIVVDSFSTDETPQIVGEYPQVKFIQHKYLNSAAQKNWIIPQARHPWILLVDADEIVTSDLRSEIQSMDLTAVKCAAYWIRRENFFFGRKLHHIWKKDKVKRLFQRDLCAYQELEVHAKLIADGPIGELSGSLEHHSFKSMEHYKNKLRRYARWSAGDYADRTGNITLYHLWIKPAARFIKHYIIQGGILDGKAGFTISRLQAWGVYLRYKYLQERRKKTLE